MNVQPEIHIEKILEYDDLFHGEDFDWYMRKRYKIATQVQREFLNQINKLRTY